MNFKTLATTMLLLALYPGRLPSRAGRGQLSGEEIMRHVNARSRGSGSRMHLEMTLHDAKRGEFHKSILMQRSRLATGYRTAYWITAPDHERGISLLLSEDAAQRGMWMYFPASKQTLKVVSRGFPALASDFSCEDLLVGIPLSDYEFRVVGRTAIDGVPAEQVEMTPRNEDLRSELGFAKSIGWVREDIWMIVRADYFDEAGELIKSYHAEDIAKVDGVWTVRTFSMLSNRVAHSTQVKVSDADYSVRPPEATFLPGKLMTGLGEEPK